MQVPGYNIAKIGNQHINIIEAIIKILFLFFIILSTILLLRFFDLGSFDKINLNAMVIKINNKTNPIYLHNKLSENNNFLSFIKSSDRVKHIEKISMKIISIKLIFLLIIFLSFSFIFYLLGYYNILFYIFIIKYLKFLNLKTLYLTLYALQCEYGESSAMKKESKKIVVLIPCYNESKTIAKVIRDYKNVLPEADIYVYDNNSIDGTDKIAEKAGAIVKYEYRQGKGNVIRSMFRDIDADCYLMIDGDDTYPAENAKEMCDIILNGKADMVIGDRLSSTYFTENKRPFHNLGNKMVRFLINKLFKNNIKDIMTGYRAFSYEFVKGFPVLSKGFEIETEMTIHAVDKNFKLVEIPISYRDRPKGSVSKLNTYSDGFKVLKTIATLFKEYKPASFFNILSFIFLVLALILGIPVVSEYFKTGLVPRFPTLIVASIVLLVALLLCITGIILQVIVKKHKQLYELYLNFLRK